MKKGYRLLYCIIFSLSFSGCNKGSDPPVKIPETIDLLNVTDCIITGETPTFDIATWNLENFPLGSKTVDNVVAIIKAMDVDLVAVQEITSTSSFEELTGKLEGWSATELTSGGLKYGYLYKENVVTITESAMTIYNNDHSAFPRPPQVITAKHQNNLEVTFINIHLKARGGQENEDRRRAASALLKEFIDTEHSTDNVIVLGDFNDLIIEDNPDDNVFKNFIDDASNYKFVDIGIAADKNQGWSYPSWPSHLDHMLITNELFDNEADVFTLSLDDCDSDYESIVSDHRPLILILDKD